MSVILASVGSGLWLTLSNAASLLMRTDGVFSVLIDTLSAVSHAIQGRIERVVVGGVQILSASSQPRIAVLFDNSSTSLLGGAFNRPTGYIPASLQSLLRPLSLLEPTRQVLIHSLCVAYEFPYAAVMCMRLEALCNWLVLDSVVHRSQMLRLVLNAVRAVGALQEKSPQDVTKLPLLIFKQILVDLPALCKARLTVEKIKIACSIYLESTCTDAEAAVLQSLEMGDTGPASQISSAIMQQKSPNLMVTGLAGTGKSHAINTALIEVLIEYI